MGAGVERNTGVRAISLTDNMSVITALANDTGYSSIFERQLDGQLEKEGVIIGISASGNCPNILEAIEYDRKNGAMTIGFIGFGGGKLKELTRKSIILSSRDYGRVEDVHISLAHIISHIVKEKIANG
ncbi:SIS domain-containing protein [Chloroflexota bacterium]